MNAICNVCGSAADVVHNASDEIYRIECPACGRFFYYDYCRIDKDMLCHYLYYKGKLLQQKRKDPNDKVLYVCTKELFEKLSGQTMNPVYVSKNDVESWYPKTFSEKVDCILTGFNDRNAYTGEKISMTYDEILSALFVKRYVESSQSDAIAYQYGSIIGYLEERKYIHVAGNLQESNPRSPTYKRGEIITIQLLSDGIMRIDELLRQHGKNSRTAFIAMKFKETDDLREALKEAIEEAGYVPYIMDEIEHNYQIVPEMLAEIRKARFFVAELSHGNNGAYYEAGYALGQGKEVIHICNENTNSHFDVKQVNTILYSDLNDLKAKLIKRIDATVTNAQN